MNIKIEIFQGAYVRPWIPAIAKLRISEFKEFPYLYAGSEEIEEEYLAHYVNDNNSLFAIAFDHKEIVGIGTGIPLLSVANFFPNCTELFKNNGLSQFMFFNGG